MVSDQGLFSPPEFSADEASDSDPIRSERILAFFQEQKVEEHDNNNNVFSYGLHRWILILIFVGEREEEPMLPSVKTWE
jgi:hypothetical protein